MGRPRSKICPDCNEHVPSTSKICECGGSVISLKKEPSSSQQVRSSRRTERTKRPKPSFYDGLEVEKQAREEKRRRKEKKTELDKSVVKTSTAASSSSSTSSTPPPATPDAPVQSHRMQLTVKKVQEEPERKEEELEEIVLTEEQRAKFSLILNDINRKICSSSWRGCV